MLTSNRQQWKCIRNVGSIWCSSLPPLPGSLQSAVRRCLELGDTPDFHASLTQLTISSSLSSLFTSTLFYHEFYSLITRMYDKFFLLLIWNFLLLMPYILMTPVLWKVVNNCPLFPSSLTIWHHPSVISFWCSKSDLFSTSWYGCGFTFQINTLLWNLSCWTRAVFQNEVTMYTISRTSASHGFLM